ncbi:MAG: hypothetical protein KatS3mg088_303 [Patescibacteria group bacterium]|nr:MAG: hypothetical protein KatS3mg088_303 [Patescibacteria group bacterium]
MTKLTQVSIITRKIIRYSIFGIMGIIALRGVILTAYKIYRHYFPAPPPPPTVSFGKLPSLPFPKKDVPTNLQFKLETPTGNLPQFPYSLKVFFMPKISPTLLSLDQTQKKALNLNFDGEQSQITETVYSFKSSKVPSELKISIATGIFSISYNLSEDPSPLDKRPPVPEVAASKARSFLSRANLLAKDLTGPTVTEPVRLEGNKIIGANSLSEANFVKVNFYRKDYDNYPAVTPNPKEANVWLIVSGETQREKEIVAGEYHYFPIDESKYATYPIKTAQQAWEELQNQKAYIANLGENQDQQITIRRIYLAYYDAGVQTDFYQPVVVFEGDRDFKAYLPAVTSQYYGE